MIAAKYWLVLGSLLFFAAADGEGLSAARLGVLYSLDDAASGEAARYYATRRAIPSENLIGLHLPAAAVMTPDSFNALRARTLEELPAAVQSLALIWSKPYAVGCMSVTTAFAAGYRAAFCQQGCARTPQNPLYDADGWLPADTVGWWPAMLLPSDDLALARAIIERGIAAAPDTAAPGAAAGATVYLVRTADATRNVRASTYAAAQAELGGRVHMTLLELPVRGEVPDAMGYFTGATHVEELPRIHFRPGALADHLTSSGGVLEGGDQMSALAWLKQGATATYGSVSEPCNFLEKFPAVAVLFKHYSAGETALESYWKSVAMPGQGLILGEPLSRPFAVRH